MFVQRLASTRLYVQHVIVFQFVNSMSWCYNVYSVVLSCCLALPGSALVVVTEKVGRFTDPGSWLIFSLSRAGFSAPCARQLSSNFAHSRASVIFALVQCVPLCLSHNTVCTIVCKFIFFLNSFSVLIGWFRCVTTWSDFGPMWFCFHSLLSIQCLVYRTNKNDMVILIVSTPADHYFMIALSV